MTLIQALFSSQNCSNPFHNHGKIHLPNRLFLNDRLNHFTLIIQKSTNGYPLSNGIQATEPNKGHHKGERSTEFRDEKYEKERGLGFEVCL